MRVQISKELCVGCGECAEISPEIFKVEDGEAVVITDEAPEYLQDRCREAADVCPVQAIDIEE